MSTPFDVAEELPPGITMLEASAGTGKTHAVSSLVARAVATGTPLDAILVVTFTRKATGTLRERVWARLASVGAALRAAPADHEHDALVRHLREAPPEEVAARARRLEVALADFDAATIATTHGFCQQVLASLGVAGDAERDAEVVDDIRDLVDDAVDDLFVRRFVDGGELLVKPEEARAIARVVVGNPGAAIARVDRDQPADVLRRSFAQGVRRRVEAQKRAARIVTYDDLLTRLQESLEGDLGPVVAARLRRRFSLAVVDEFQDTDVVQWRILQAAFGHDGGRLVLVGDPKQAIYAFRGGDVHAYLQAAGHAATQRSLPVSWRADQPLLDALDGLLGGVSLGDPRIRHTTVQARPGAEERRLLGPTPGAPVRWRVLDTARPDLVRIRGGRAVQVGSARRAIAADVAAVAREILAAGTRVVERDEHGSVVADRALEVTDLAVLVRTKAFADEVRDALVGAGVAAVVHGGSSVLTTEAAGAWLGLLRALDRPAVSTAVHGIASGPFVGWEAASLADDDEDRWEGLRDDLHAWAATFRARGVPALLRHVGVQTDLACRLLRTTEGDRTLSDLRHVAELLHGRHSAHPGTIATLAAWLADEVERARRAEAEEGRRRLSSDAPSVSVMTVHGAKGLEFPIVLLPSLWDALPERDDDVVTFHDPDGTRCIAVGRGGREASAVQRSQVSTARAESAAEELRLLYVALTRARHQVVCWWATGNDADRSALARVLLGRRDDEGSVPDALKALPKSTAIRDALDAIAADRPDLHRVEPADGLAPAAEPDPGVDPALLAVRSFERTFDDRWVRTSYSALTAAAHDAGAHGVETVDLDEGPLVDEPEEEVGAPAVDAPSLPLGELPGGAGFGSLVHEVLEELDFGAADLALEVARAATSTGALRALGPGGEALVPGLVTALSTPLGPLFDDRPLRSFARADRLDELAFDLPLAGGDRPTGVVTMDAIADVFAAHVPVADPLGPYHERLRDPVLAAEVRGFLTGSIDLVARVGGVDGRHVVVDYKTNRLAPTGTTLTAAHYRPPALADAMQDAHYPLQASLYAVALHRFLRWRLRGYDPDRHLGGVAYLFLRGMAGEPGTGVFAWQPPSAFVLELSDLLDQGRVPS